MATEGTICRNVTSTQVAICNVDENEAGLPITWCSDSCFYSIICCRYAESSQPVIENEPPLNDIPQRPDTSVTENEQSQGSYTLLGTGSAVNNQASQVDATDNNQSYLPPSPAPTSSSKVGVGIGFALVAIAIGAVLIWKRDGDKNDTTTGDSSKTGANIASNTHNSPSRRDAKDSRIRRESSSSNRRRSSNGSTGTHKKRKENRTIYDSDGSLDSDFIINTRRMRIDPINSDSDSEFSAGSIPL
eukprot:scaffold2701_cov137-Skeletonema_dohrnii-CCMP3373.AAC.11